MQSSPEIRNKLVLVIGELICRCIEEARKIPFILEQEQVVDILVANPDYFAKLVGEEQRDRTEYARDRLTAKLDAAIELGQFEALDVFDVSLMSIKGGVVDLEEVMKQVNQLTRTFAVYFGNIITIFEKEFQLFAERFRQHLQQSGMALQPTELTLRDMTALSQRAETYLVAGHFLQAFSFARVLNSQIVSKEIAILPSPEYSLERNLIRNALQDANLSASFVKFLLRICYISQGTWQDLFGILVNLVYEEPALFSKSSLIDRIEQDGIFCCNLLCDSLASLRALPADARREAIDKRLSRWKSTVGGN